MFDKGPITISDENPFVVGELVLYANRLHYRDIRCNFNDIEHLGWKWTAQTYNFFTKHFAHLTLFIRGIKAPVKIHSTTLVVTPKLVTAYRFIAKETYKNRLEFYANSLEELGGFIYEDWYFYADGRVIVNGNTFTLFDRQVEPFYMILKRVGKSKPKAKLINLVIDRDVLSPLIDYILENPREPNQIRENHNKRKEDQDRYRSFLRDVVSMAAILSKADGHVSPEEVNIVRSFLNETLGASQNQFAEAISIFNDARNSTNSFEYYTESLSARFRNEKETLLTVLDFLFSIALADGVLSAEEELLLLAAESIFCVQGVAFNRYKLQEREAARSEEEHCLEILGLSKGATKDRIRKVYLRLAVRFHPDRVHHLGEDYVREAVSKMKLINQAYEYLCQLADDAP